MFGKRKDGSIIYGKLCNTYHKLKYGLPKWQHRRGYNFSKEVTALSKQPCKRCGWNESFCDRHRLIGEF